MLFNSAEFCLLFFPLVTGLYFLLPRKWRWLLLLLASCWFYMAFVPLFILILAFTIGVDYVAGIAIERSEGPRRKAYLITSIIANVGVLAVFKYWDFLNGNLTALFGSIGVEYHVPKLKEWTFFGWLPAGMVLPIGLSFHTFQSLSYTIEVYRKHQKAEHRFGVFALYVMFYPQLVAGPIERPGNLLNQLNAADGHGIRSDFDYDRIVWGLKQMLWGFFKKLVIADRCGAVVDQVYGHVGQYEALSLLLATYLFAFQIYCDFSGYTDIALGAARVMGFDLMVNFRTPYRSASISEFWSRWHISLSSWFRDYLYIPLGGNRKGPARTYLNLLVVFFLTGLWHGASWNFVVWGMIHGAFMAMERAGFGKMLERAPVIVARAYTLLVVLVAWAFFRIEDLTSAWRFVQALWIPAHGDPSIVYPAYYLTNDVATALAAGLIGGLGLYDRALAALRQGPWKGGIPGTAHGTRDMGLLALFVLTAMAVATRTYDPFIYFRF